MDRVSAKLITIFFVTSIWSLGNATPKTPLTFGVVPQQAASKIVRTWGPLIQHLSESTGLDIHLKTAPTIPEFEARLARGAYDIAYMNPHHYTIFSKKVGYRAIAKQKDKFLRGIIVVHRDSGLHKLEHLDDKALAFPSPGAFAASMVVQSKLAEIGIVYSASYVASHDSVYKGVSRGFFSAGGGIERTLAHLAPDIRSKLRVLWKSPPYTPHAFSVHPRLDDSAASRIVNSLIALSASDRGNRLLTGINIKEISPALDSDWDDVRRRVKP